MEELPNSPWRTENNLGLHTGDVDRNEVSGFSKLPQGPIEELDFTDDNVETLLVLLCIAHLNFKDMLIDLLPSKDLLIQLATICDKYLFQQLLKP